MDEVQALGAATFLSGHWRRYGVSWQGTIPESGQIIWHSSVAPFGGAAGPHVAQDPRDCGEGQCGIQRGRSQLGRSQCLGFSRAVSVRVARAFFKWVSRFGTGFSTVFSFLLPTHWLSRADMDGRYRFGEQARQRGGRSAPA